MAWEAVCLLQCLMLVLLASGCCEKFKLLQKLEGESLSVKCRVTQSQLYWKKVWCLVPLKLTYSCIILPMSSRFRAESPLFIQDDSGFYYITFTATDLKVEDSGLYCCGTYKASSFYSSSCYNLMISQASTPPTTRSGWTSGPQPATDRLYTNRSSRGTAGGTSVPQPLTDSPPGHWRLILALSISAAAVLLLGSIGLLILCCRKARGRAGQGKTEPHIYSDLTALEGKDLQTGSAEDSGAISYASLTHRHNIGPQDSIYVNTLPSTKHVPDPLPSVEYATIAGKRPSPPS